MNTIRLITGCAVAMFSLAAAAQTSNSTSGSGSTSLSGATSTSQGNGSSINTLGMDASTRSNSSSGSQAVAISGQGGFSGGNTVTTNVTVSTGAADSGTSGTSGSATGSKLAAAGTQADPVTSKSVVDYQGSYTVRNTPSIAGPALTTTLSDTCMGSVSFGLSITGFGATGGSTIVDQACVRRLDAREFRAMGLNDVALALLCESASNRAAVEATGHLCPGTTAPLKTSGKAHETASSADYQDPLVRARLGLTPLHEDTLSAR